MLTWKQPSRRKPAYFASLDRSNPAGINAAIVEAWTKFLDGLDALPPERWSILLAYIVVETGDFSLHATTREEPGNWLKDLSVTLDIHDWAMEYGDIDDLDDLDEEAAPDPKAEARFHRKYIALLKKMARSIKDAMADPGLAPRFASLRKRDRFAVYYVDQGESVHTANLVYLSGKRPPKAFPAATPRELFTGLMHKASIWPENCLKFRGDEVIEVTFFGHEFDDKYVDILESVPDVTTLCKDLRVLKLEYTWIKPAGVERLKALFPRAKLKIKS